VPGTGRITVENIYILGQKAIVSGNGRQEKVPRDPCIRNEAVASFGTLSSFSWASKTIMQMIIVSSFIYPH
jgi:hypothetical protein